VSEAGLQRHADAKPIERVPLLSYLVELLIRSGETECARDVRAELELTDQEQLIVGDELSAVAELEKSLHPSI